MPPPRTCGITVEMSRRRSPLTPTDNLDTVGSINLLALAISDRLHLYQTRTGADYYIAPIGQVVEDLEDCLRLEVSGTDLGVSEIKRRLREKVDQAFRGDSNLPALACVVGFRVQLIVIQTVEVSG